VKSEEDDSRKQSSPWEEKSKSFHSQFRYGRREAIAYAASRLPAMHGTALRVLTEASVH